MDVVEHYPWSGEAKNPRRCMLAKPTSESVRTPVCCDQISVLQNTMSACVTTSLQAKSCCTNGVTSGAASTAAASCRLQTVPAYSKLSNSSNA